MCRAARRRSKKYAGGPYFSVGSPALFRRQGLSAPCPFLFLLLVLRAELVALLLTSLLVLLASLSGAFYALLALLGAGLRAVFALLVALAAVLLLRFAALFGLFALLLALLLGALRAEAYAKYGHDGQSHHFLHFCISFYGLYYATAASAAVGRKDTNLQVYGI